MNILYKIYYDTGYMNKYDTWKSVLWVGRHLNNSTRSSYPALAQNLTTVCTKKCTVGVRQLKPPPVYRRARSSRRLVVDTPHNSSLIVARRSPRRCSIQEWRKDMRMNQKKILKIQFFQKNQYDKNFNELAILYNARKLSKEKYIKQYTEINS